MRLMLDSNVFLDVLLERELFVEDSCDVLSLCEDHKVDGFVSASAITDIFYIVRKYTHNMEIAYKAIGKVLDIVKVADVTNGDVLEAYQRGGHDFEDALVAVCAASANCSYIITRNKKDFEEFNVPAVSPAEFLNEIL